MSIWDRFPSALSRAKELHRQPEPICWYGNIAATLNEEFGADGFTYNGVRNKIRRDPLTEGMERVRATIIKQPLSLKDEVLKAIQKQQDVSALCSSLGVSERILGATLEDLKEDGYSIAQTGNVIKLCKDLIPQENEYSEAWNGERIVRFGVVSDTHLCSKHQQLTFLNHLYDVFQREGLTTVYHAGDVADGYYKNRPGHVYEVFKLGAGEQAKYIIENYPSREGIVTKFITGNHDHTHILNGGIDIGELIKQARPDMHYLGQANARVSLTPNCVMEINHPLDGSAYALSYSIQKYIESMSGGDKPNILLNGHHHKAMYVFYRNVHGFECGTTEAQTPWMKGKRLAAHMSGWIIECYVDEEGTITRIRHELIPLYKPLKDDY